MSALSVIALVAGTLGVWLTIKQTIWCWPVSLVAVVVSVAEFYNERLYGDMSLQIFYFFAGVYGWIFWRKNRNRVFVARHMSQRYWPLLIIITVAQALLYYKLIVHFNGDRPVIDAALTAASLTATYMMTRKWVQNWVAWIFIDAFYVYLFISKEMWLFGVLYAFFTGMAFYGWVVWRRQVQTSSLNTEK